MEIYYDLSEDCKQRVLNDDSASDELKELLGEEVCEGIKFYDVDNSKYYFVPIKFYPIGSMHRVNGTSNDLKASYHEKSNIDMYVNETSPNPRYATYRSMGIAAMSRKYISKKVATIMFDSAIEVSENDFIEIEKKNFSKTHYHYMAQVNHILSIHRNYLLKHFKEIIDVKEG